MRGRLVAVYIVVYIALVVALTVVRGMVESWVPAAALALVVAALIFVLMVRIVAGPGWRRFLVVRGTELRPWDMLLVIGNALAVMIGLGTATEVRGDLPALLVIGLVAATPVAAAVALRFWWWLPRVAAARARQDSSADDAVDPGRG